MRCSYPVALFQQDKILTLLHKHTTGLYIIELKMRKITYMRLAYKKLQPGRDSLQQNLTDAKLLDI
jgi:hypothetical protein